MPVAGVRELAIGTSVMAGEASPVVPGITVDIEEEAAAVAPAINDETKAAAAAAEQVVTP